MKEKKKFRKIVRCLNIEAKNLIVYLILFLISIALITPVLLGVCSCKISATLHSLGISIIGGVLVAFFIERNNNIIAKKKELNISETCFIDFYRTVIDLLTIINRIINDVYDVCAKDVYDVCAKYEFEFLSEQEKAFKDLNIIGLIEKQLNMLKEINVSILPSIIGNGTISLSDSMSLTRKTEVEKIYENSKDRLKDRSIDFNKFKEGFYLNKIWLAPLNIIDANELKYLEYVVTTFAYKKKSEKEGNITFQIPFFPTHIIKIFEFIVANHCCHCTWEKIGFKGIYFDNKNNLLNITKKGR